MRQHSLSINGLRLQCYERGNPGTPPVVLLHGGSAHARWWDGFADAIADAYHVVALDLRGHGHSAHAHPPKYRIEDYASDVAAGLDALGFAHVILVGHSLGGLVAASYAGQTAERLTALVIVDTPVRISAAGARYMQRLQHFPQPIHPDRDTALRRFRLLPTQTTATPETLAHVAAHAIRQLHDGRWTLRFDRASLSQPEPQDQLPALQQLNCPILLVRGAHSTVLSHDKFSSLLTALPHAEGIEIPEAYHHVMLDNPADFTGAVRAFLDKVRTQQRASVGLAPSIP